MRKLSLILEKPSLLLLLAGLYPATFLASINWQIFTASQLIFLLVTTPIISLALGVSLHFVSLFSLKIVERFFFLGKAPFRVQSNFQFVAASTAVVVISFLLYSPIRELIPSDILTVVLIVIFLLLSLWLTKKNGTKGFSAVLLFLTVVSAVGWIHSSAVSVAISQEIDGVEYESISYNEKPNI